MGQGSELLRSIVAGAVRSHKGAVERDLDGVADKTDADALTDEPVADAVAGAGETDRAVLVDPTQDLTAFSWS